MALYTAFDGRLGMAESRGLTNVTWARRPAARILRAALRLPGGKAGSELSMSYSDHDVSDTWTRTIGQRKLVSRCWIDGSRLIEQFGPFGVVSEVAAAGRGLSVRQVRVEFYGFRVPGRLTPTVRTRTWRGTDGVLVSATTLRGPSGRVLCRSASAMQRVAIGSSAGHLHSVRPAEVDVPVHSQHELKLVG